MGGVLESSSIKGEGEPAPFSYIELFEKQLPYYISLGMSPVEFYDGDPMLVKAYREAYKLKRRQMNEELWLQGVYFYNALCNVTPIMHAFAESGSKPIPYPEEPYAITKEEIDEKKEKEEQKQLENLKKSFEIWAITNNQRLAQ